ncbi:MAG: ArsA family ATPase [Acidimicrobiales bacterium]
MSEPDAVVDADGAKATEGRTGAAPGSSDIAVSLGTVAATRSVVVCCGPGGVGKTTVSASFGVEAARLGRRACVVTVDPARRLASSLGLESLPNTPARVPGGWPGTLDAVMLDSKSTFDELVERYARTADQAAAIKANRLYQNLTGALSGTQEYMAMEKLYELTTSGDYDVVVVDTPPTRNALDLLDAPRRLTQFLENRLFRALMMPTRLSLRALNVATQALLKTISGVAGAEIVQDAVAFFQAFQGMEVGFDERADAVRQLLADPGTAYVIVTSPRADAVDEASYFAERLDERSVRASGLVVNRVHPRFWHEGGALPGTGAPDGSDLAALVDNLAALDDIAQAEGASFGSLAARVGPAPVRTVPLLGSDVHDLDGLVEIAHHLFPTEPGGARAGVG